MSCSKIFSGNLPELTYEIIKYFKNDFTTLYSCILVNRLWCRLAIPLLWENPFSIPTKNYNFIEIYLDNLNGDFQTKLNEYKINDNSLLSNTLFNYPKFLKYLNIYNIVSSVEKWFEVAIRLSKPGRNTTRYFLQDLSFYPVSNFKRLINISLFKIIIENEVNLHTLEIEIPNTYYNTTYYNKCYENILELILQNTNFIHNIRYLKLYSSFDFSFHNNNNNDYTLIKYRISQIINLHQNLKKILLSFNSLPLYNSLLLSKDSNCLNTLNTIIFYCVNFKGIINLDKIFEQLNVLESIHIIYCSSLNNGFVKQIINLSKPFKLKSLFISEISQIESLKLLLQKSGDYIENFGYGFTFDYDPSLKQQLLDLIIKYCKNIKFLDLYRLESRIAYLLFNLIENINQNLNYLSINEEYLLLNDNIEFSSIILQNLGQTLPSKLEYLNLVLHIKVNDFKIFLENSQNTFINNFLIMQKGSDDILHYIKEYIMKKKRINHLAIKNTFIVRYYEQNNDLFNLKEEVKEFKLHNIDVQSYSDLSTNVYDFIKKID
jgi:hypothetical protein